MFIARNKYGEPICARCGCSCRLTKDHYIPKSCRMTVNKEGNYVGLCSSCNRWKANRVVLPQWYNFLGASDRAVLLRYFRYAGSFIKETCKDKDVLDYLERLEGDDYTRI